MSQSSKPIPIAMPNALAEKIKNVCDITDLKQQEVIRLAIAIGLEDMKRANYDIAGAIVDAAEKYDPRGKPEAPTVKPGPATSPNVINALSSAPFKTAQERSIAAEKGASYQAKKTKTSSRGQQPA